VRALVDRFYDLMDLEPAYAGIRALHPPTLDGSRDKLFWFLCGWLGGPNHYIERFGHPRLRARHLPYAIGIAERDQWMACMLQAMGEQDRGRPGAGAAAGRVVLRHRRLDAQQGRVPIEQHDHRRGAGRAGRSRPGWTSGRGAAAPSRRHPRRGGGSSGRRR
jgi:truncated hemoglobin YjbI